MTRSLPAIFLLAVGLSLLALIGGILSASLYEASEHPDQIAEQWRQEQIATTGNDPCELIYATERKTRDINEQGQAGMIDHGDVMNHLTTNDYYPTTDMTWEDKEAYQNYRWELHDKCPSLEYVESLN